MAQKKMRQSGEGGRESRQIKENVGLEVADNCSAAFERRS